MEQGVYLLVQTDKASYGTVEPFLIGIPHMENGSERVYDVQTETKGEPVTEEITEPTEKPVPVKATEEKKESDVETEKPKTGDTDDYRKNSLLALFAGIAVTVSAGVLYNNRKKENRQK